MSGGLRLPSGRVLSDECCQEVDHSWAGTDDGHNCTACDPSSIWKCDKEAHWIPRFEEDPVAHRLGFHEDGCACPEATPIGNSTEEGTDG